MGLFAPAKPKRTIVKDYGRDTFLVAANLLLAPVVAALGLRVGLLSEADVRDRMERDSLRMAERGYRVAAADRLAVPWLARLGLGDRTSFYRVTYELAATPAEAPPRHT
jgi:hypothetical protein